MASWQPILPIEELEEYCLEQRGRGKTWRKVISELGTSKSHFYRWAATIPGFLERVNKQVKAEARENIKSTLLEVALKDKNVTALIFLSKALCKMYDQPYAKEHKAPVGTEAEPLVPAVTREQWKALHEERQKKKCVP